MLTNASFPATLLNAGSGSKRHDGIEPPIFPYYHNATMSIESSIGFRIFINFLQDSGVMCCGYINRRNVSSSDYMMGHLSTH